MRVGIALGEATEEAGDWYGMPVVRAARLCAAAEPDQILVDQFVSALADYADARFEPRGELPLKGISRPVTTPELVWATTQTSIPLPASIATGATATFVGRDEHLHTLRSAWARAGSGTALVLLAGEPGAGKTSLACKIAVELHDDQGAVAMFGRCDDGLGLAYQPFAQALEHYVRHADDVVVQAHVDEHGGDLRRLVPHLADRVAGVPEPTVGDPASEQRQLFEAVVGLLGATAEQVPAVLVIDDLHWATSPTLQLLTHLVRAQPAPPLLILATYRDTELTRTHPLSDLLAELRRFPSIERVRVGGLDPAETEMLVEALAHHDLDEASRAFAQALHDRTEGNPFFAIEMLRHLAESGAIEVHEGRWRATADAAAMSLPEGVKEVVGRRLSRLPDGTNAALAVAAVAGLEFDARVVARVLRLDLGDLLDALDPAVRAGIVREAARSHCFAFTHALTLDTLREEAGAARRVHLHGQIAEAIEQVNEHDVEPVLADLAYHHAEAAHSGRTAPAVEAALRAAAQARRLAATDDAIALLERGLAAARLADKPDPEAQARLLVALAETTVVDSPPRARAYATEASDLAAEAGLPELIAEAAGSMWSAFNTSTAGPIGGDPWLIELCHRALTEPTRVAPATRARVMAMLVLMSGWRTDDEVDPAMADDAVALAEADGDPAARLISSLARWASRTPSDRDIRSFLAINDAATASTPDWHLRGMGAVYLSWAASVVGDRERFALALERVDDAYAALKSPRLQSWSAWLRAAVALREGRWRDAIERTGEAREASPDPAIAEMFLRAHVGIAWLQQGLASELLAQFAELETLDTFDSNVLTFRALVEALAGDRTAARRTLDFVIEHGLAEPHPSGCANLAVAAWAAAVARDRSVAPMLEAKLRPYRGQIAVGGPMEIGAVDRFAAMLAALDGRLDDADGLFEAALDLEERYGSPVFATHTRCEWARCLLDRAAARDREHAAELLDACIAEADRLGMAQVAAEARALAT